MILVKSRTYAFTALVATTLLSTQAVAGSPVIGTEHSRNLRTLEMANAQIDTLDEVTGWEETRYGQKLAPHPVFKVQKDAQDSITRQMKILGLTTELLAGTDETDPLVELTKKVVKSGKKKPVVVKPDTD